MAHLTPIGLCLVAVALVAACGGSNDGPRGRPAADAMETSAAAAAPVEPKVSAVMIGKRIGPGNRITEPSFQFAPRDTVHLSVATDGGNGQLTAAWRSQTGQILKQSTESIRAAGENTAFYLSQPKGFKPGTYKVVLFLNQDSIDTKVFVVQR
jgi:uncharacterized protein YukJ